MNIKVIFKKSKRDELFKVFQSHIDNFTFQVKPEIIKEYEEDDSYIIVYNWLPAEVFDFMDEQNSDLEYTFVEDPLDEEGEASMTTSADLGNYNHSLKGIIPINKKKIGNFVKKLLGLE